jgi:hypothetical protein
MSKLLQIPTKSLLTGFKPSFGVAQAKTEKLNPNHRERIHHRGRKNTEAEMTLFLEKIATRSLASDPAPLNSL